MLTNVSNTYNHSIHKLSKTSRKNNNKKKLLTGFTKEQIRVQANNQRLLVIHGQRPIIEESDSWARFSKHVKLPDDCDENKITAKLVSGVLTITMRKKDASSIVRTTEVLSSEEARSSQSMVHNNLGRKIGNCTIKRATEDRGKDAEMRGLLSLAGKVVVVVIVVAVSGAYVHACITKKRPCNVVN